MAQTAVQEAILATGTTSREPMRLALRKWSDHVFWTREYFYDGPVAQYPERFGSSAARA
jgi:hypothetical protein